MPFVSIPQEYYPQLQELVRRWGLSESEATLRAIQQATAILNGNLLLQAPPQSSQMVYDRL